VESIAITRAATADGGENSGATSSTYEAIGGARASTGPPLVGETTASNKSPKGPQTSGALKAWGRAGNEAVRVESITTTGAASAEGARTQAPPAQHPRRSEEPRHQLVRH
jgi:hypothetical protein